MTARQPRTIPQPKTFHVTSFGCQMNVYDGERMAELLSRAGHDRPPTIARHADLVVLNTCHIRERAVDKVYSDIGRMRQATMRRADGTVPMIAVAGCVAQAEGEEIMARAPLVGVVVGPQAYHRLPAMVAAAAHWTDAPPTPICRRDREIRSLAANAACSGADRIPDGAGRL